MAADMISWEEALSRILEEVVPLAATCVPLADLLGSVLSEPLVASMDSPPFDNSAVDGYAVAVSDLIDVCQSAPATLKVAGEIRAGSQELPAVQPGVAVKILTGAPVPPGAEAVVMKEYCAHSNGCVRVNQSVKPGENIRRRGAEFVQGQTVLPAGTLVTPPVVGLLASLGHAAYPAFKRPRAAVVTTGSELVEPGKQLMPGKIYDANSFSVAASLAALGVRDVSIFRAAEDLQATRQAFDDALASASVVISTGGVSVGDYDHVKEALKELRVTCHLWRIAMKPGKPVFFGVHNGADGRKDDENGKRYVFGLPGNPVSALVTFNLFVLPALAKLMGLDACCKWRPAAMKARLMSPLHKKPGRAEFVRGRLSFDTPDLVVTPVRGQDSHMLSGLALANCLIVFPLDCELLPEGSLVDVRPLRYDLSQWA